VTFVKSEKHAAGKVPVAFFAVLGGSILGALFLAAVLGELPAFGFYEVLGMLLAIVGFPTLRPNWPSMITS